MVTKDRCRAKDRATCPKHGHSNPELNLAAFKEFLRPSARELSAVKDPAAIVGVAANSALEYQGGKPAWWKKFEGDATTNPSLPTRPELVDVIDSPAGPLAVVWENQSQLATDAFILRSGRGIHSCSYRSMETGEVLGYIKMDYVDEATFQRSFGDDEFTPFRWHEERGGVLYGITYGADGELGKLKEGTSEEELVALRRKVWLTARKHISGGTLVLDEHGKPVPNNQIHNHMPDDATIAADMKNFTSQLNTSIAEYKRVAGVPVVDLSQIEQPLVGRGFGSALYVYTARMLAKQGKVLRASQYQQPVATIVWDRLEEKFPKHVGWFKFDINGDVQSPRVLDFRA